MRKYIQKLVQQEVDKRMNAIAQEQVGGFLNIIIGLTENTQDVLENMHKVNNANALSFQDMETKVLDITERMNNLQKELRPIVEERYKKIYGK